MHMLPAEEAANAIALTVAFSFQGGKKWFASSVWFVWSSLPHSPPATSGATYQEMRDSAATLASGTGRIYFYRPSQIGSAIQPDVNLDGSVVGTAISHGFVYVDTLPGTHEVVLNSEITDKTHVQASRGRDVQCPDRIGVRHYPRSVLQPAGCCREGEAKCGRCITSAISDRRTWLWQVCRKA